MPTRSSSVFCLLCVALPTKSYKQGQSDALDKSFTNVWVVLLCTPVANFKQSLEVCVSHRTRAQTANETLLLHQSWVLFEIGFLVFLSGYSWWLGKSSPKVCCTEKSPGEQKAPAAAQRVCRWCGACAGSLSYGNATSLSASADFSLNDCFKVNIHLCLQQAGTTMNGYYQRNVETL